MKTKILFIIIFAAACCKLSGQGITSAVTVYKEFKPAMIQLADGRKLKQPLANIFLKNSSLLYKHGSETMEANLANVLSVQFDDRTYVKIDTLLAYRVDTVASNALYCAKVIDIEAYRQSLANNQVITNLSLGDLVSSTTIDLTDESDTKLPIIPLYYYNYNGKYVWVHERHLSRMLNKEKRRIMKSVMAQPGFSWTSEEWLLKLLKAIS